MLIAYLYLTGAMVLVGSSVVVGKLIVADFPVMLASGLTSVIAVACLVPMVIRLEGRFPRPAPRDLGILVLQAFLGSFLWRIFLLSGLSLTTAAESGVITATTPAAIGVISFLLGERLSGSKVGGIALSVLGILAINALGADLGAERGPNPPLGNLLIFGSVLGEAMFTICGKAVLGRVSPLAVSTLVSLSSLLMFLPFALYDLARFDLRTVPVGGWLAIGYFGFFLNVCAFILWFRGVQRVSAGTAAVFTGVLPISALLLSYIVLKESFLWSHLIGAACVLLGIALIARDDTRAPRPSPTGSLP